MAQVALIGVEIGIERHLSRLECPGTIPLEKFVGDDSLRVAFSDSPVEAISIKRRVRTTASLQMVGKPCSCPACLLAKRALNPRRTVSRRIQALIMRVSNQRPVSGSVMEQPAECCSNYRSHDRTQHNTNDRCAHGLCALHRF